MKVVHCFLKLHILLRNLCNFWCIMCIGAQDFVRNVILMMNSQLLHIYANDYILTLVSMRRVFSVLFHTHWYRIKDTPLPFTQVTTMLVPRITDVFLHHQRHDNNVKEVKR